MQVRKIMIHDALNFVSLIQQVERESDFMLFEPNERQLTSEQQKNRIEAMGDNSTILVAEFGNRLVGYMIVNGGFANRNKHSAYLVVGVLKEFTGQGIGTRLFKELEQLTTHLNIHRLELTVMKHNERAISLYKKMGFEIEGTKRHSLFINGEFIDEYYMSKLV